MPAAASKIQCQAPVQHGKQTFLLVGQMWVSIALTLAIASFHSGVSSSYKPIPGP